jgi:protein-S-isoprenylcysteine O-methyltransferase
VSDDAVSWLGYAFMLSEVMLAVMRRSRRGDAAIGADRGSLLLLWVVIVISIMLAYSFAYAAPAASMGGAARQPLRIVGLLVFVAGLALRWYAIIYLGRFFTVNVAIAADHRVIDSGPYRYLRHPSYTGALAAFLGLGLCLANWLSLACAIIPVSAAFWWRIRVEEAALVNGLGDNYRDYMRRTRRLIPGIF